MKQASNADEKEIAQDIRCIDAVIRLGCYRERHLELSVLQY